MHGVDDPLPAGQGVLAMEVRHLGIVFRRRPVDGRAFGQDKPHPALGPPPVIGRHVLARHALGREGTGHGRHDDAVFQLQGFQAEGTEEGGGTGCHGKTHRNETGSIFTNESTTRSNSSPLTTGASCGAIQMVPQPRSRADSRLSWRSSAKWMWRSGPCFVAQPGVHLGVGRAVGLAFPVHECDVEDAFQPRPHERRRGRPPPRSVPSSPGERIHAVQACALAPTATSPPTPWP